MCAVPGKERRARRAAPVEFLNVLQLVGGNFDFILQNASGPKQPDDVGLLSLTQPNREIGRVLPQISGRPVDLKLLPNAIREDFNLGANGGLVVVQPLERQPQRIVLVAAFVAKQHSGPVILRDQKINRPVIVVIPSDDGTRLFELNLVKPDIDSNVLPSIRTKIPEEANFRSEERRVGKECR